MTAASVRVATGLSTKKRVALPATVKAVFGAMTAATAPAATGLSTKKRVALAATVKAGSGAMTVATAPVATGLSTKKKVALLATARAATGAMTAANAPVVSVARAATGRPFVPMIREKVVFMEKELLTRVKGGLLSAAGMSLNRVQVSARPNTAWTASNKMLLTR